MPRGSCENVIQATKAIVRLKAALHLEAFGIIDRDYRLQNQVNAWLRHNIFALKVAEIENMLCVPEVLKVVASYKNLDPSDICQQVIDFVINELEKDLENQVAKRSASKIQYILNRFNAQESTEKSSLMEKFNNLVTSIDVSKIYENNLNLYKDVIVSKEYKKALLIYKKKKLTDKTAPFFKEPSGGYLKLIVNLLSSEYKNSIVSAFKEYTPTIPI